MLRKTKSERIKVLLQTTYYGASEIADIVGCSSRLVTGIRRQMRLEYRGETVEHKVARLAQDVRDLRAQMRELANGRAACHHGCSSELPKRQSVEIS